MNEVGNRIKTYTDELLDQYHPGNSLTSVSLETQRMAADVRAEVAKLAIGTALLENGRTLSAYSDEEYAGVESDAHKYMPNVHLYVNDRETRVMGKAGLRIWGRGWDFNDGSWLREIDVSFAHVNLKEKLYAYEELKLSASSSRTPTISTNIFVPEYFETGYEGLQVEHRDVHDRDVDEFISVIEMLRPQDV